MLGFSRRSLTLIGLLCLGAIQALHSAPRYAVEIDLGEQRAYLLRDGRMVSEAPICSGRAKYPTPTGRFKIIEKDMDHRSSLYGKILDARGRTVVSDADSDMPVPAGGKFVNAPMAYFMRFTGGVGMHAGYLPGYPASHGCVRLGKADAMRFFSAVGMGSPVTVFGTAPRRRAAGEPSGRRSPDADDRRRQDPEERYWEEPRGRRIYEREEPIRLRPFYARPWRW